MTIVKDRVAFITGGVSGIGLGMARVFVDAGMKVVITYMREEHLREAMPYFREHKENVIAIRLDVTDRDAVKEAADKTERVFGKVHLLCNNAGINLFGPMDEATSDDWDWILGVNLGGVVNTLLTFIPRIKAHGEGGHIVNVASMAAMVPGPESGIYTTSKAAVRALSECLQYALAPYKIGVSVFCPGLVRTNIHESFLRRPSHLPKSGLRVSEAFQAKWKAMQALGMDPLDAAKRVLHGIRRNDLFIFSHTDLKEDLVAYFSEILNAFPHEPPDDKRAPLVDARRRAIKTLKNLIRVQSEE